MKIDDERKNMEMMYKIRNKRCEEINEQGLNSYIPYVGFYGQGDMNDENSKIFRITEVIKKDDGRVTAIEKFYAFKNEEPMLIAVRGEDGIFVPIQGQSFSMNNRTQVASSPEIEALEKCIEEREKNLKLFLQQNGIKEEEIENLNELELEMKLRQLNIGEKDDDQDIKEQELEKDESQPVSEEEKKEVKAQSINEVDLSTQVDTRGTTLLKAMNLEREGFTKLHIVHAEQLTINGDEREIIKYGIYGEKPDGSLEKIPDNKLRMYRGNNDETYSLDDSETVNKKHANYTFEIVGTDKRLIIDQNSNPYGRAEVYLSQASIDNDGNMAQKVQNQHQGTERSDVEVRREFNGYHGSRNIQENIKSAKDNGVDGQCNDEKLSDMDDASQPTHVHEDSIVSYGGQEISIQEFHDVKLGNKGEPVENTINEINERLNNGEEMEQILEEMEEKANDNYRGNNREH